MKIPLVGPSNAERSLPFDAQRSINLYPVMDQQGKEVSALYGTPGLSSFAVAGLGPIRGAFAAANGRGFVVSGNTLYELSSDGTATSRGTLGSITSIITMADNGVQLAVCDGTSLYILTYATNVFIQVTDVDFPGSSTVAFIDGYFAISVPSSKEFFLSALYDGTSWDALQFASKEGSPDNLNRVHNAIGLLWLFGDKSIEVWSNIGGAGFPFARIAGAKIETGCAAPYSVASLDNSVFWVGRNMDGWGMVYRANGFTPQRISNNSIEYLLQKVADLSQLRSYTYQEDGHMFYVLTGDGMSTTLVYDVTTGQWHERAYLNPEGGFETHLSTCHMFIFDKHLVGSRNDGNIYEMSLDYFDDDGEPLKAQRIFTHLYNEGKYIRLGNLEVDFESGVGLQSGQGSDPVCWLEVSEDLGRTYGNEMSASIGAVGQYRTRAVWRKLGGGYAFTLRLSITDPVKRAICGAYLL